MGEFPTLTSFAGLALLIVFGAIMAWLRESGAREERERQERMREYERTMEENKQKEMQAYTEREERKKRLLEQMPDERRKLYYWREDAEMNELGSPEALVNFYAEVGAILVQEKSQMLNEVKEVWDKMMALPRL